MYKYWNVTTSDATVQTKHLITISASIQVTAVNGKFNFKDKLPIKLDVPS